MAFPRRFLKNRRVAIAPALLCENLSGFEHENNRPPRIPRRPETQWSSSTASAALLRDGTPDLSARRAISARHHRDARPEAGLSEPRPPADRRLFVENRRQLFHLAAGELGLEPDPLGLVKGRLHALARTLKSRDIKHLTPRQCFWTLAAIVD
jgi:hypothetical protein